jgi:cyclase
VEHYRVVEVAAGVFAAISRPGGGGVGNAAIVAVEGGTLVFDTGMTPQAGEELRQAAERLGPVRTVVNSHWHGDHIRGNQAFPSAEIVATTRTKELIETRAAERLAQHRAMDAESAIAAEPEGPERESTRQVASTIAEVELRPPTRTFDNDRIELAPGCVLVTLGGGHTESDAFLLVPRARVALMADLFAPRLHPWMGDGDPARWVEILRVVEGLGADTFVPGHGEVGTIEELREFRGHLEAFLADPDGIEERYPDWDFQGGMPERNRAALGEKVK